MKNIIKKVSLSLIVLGVLGTSIFVIPQETAAYSRKDLKERQEALERTEKIVKYHQNAFEIKEFMVKLQDLKKKKKLSTTSDAYTLVSYLQNAAPYYDINRMDKFEVVYYLSAHNIVKKKKLSAVVQALEPAVQLAYNWTSKSTASLAKKKIEQLIDFTLAAESAAKKGNSFTYDDIKNIKMN